MTLTVCEVDARRPNALLTDGLEVQILVTPFVSGLLNLGYLHGYIWKDGSHVGMLEFT